MAWWVSFLRVWACVESHSYIHAVNMPKLCEVLEVVGHGAQL